MVSRNHLDADAGSMTGLDGGNSFRPRRIDHALQPQKTETGSHGLMIERHHFRTDLLARKRQDPQPARCHPFHLAHHLFAVQLTTDTVCIKGFRTPIEENLDRALDIGDLPWSLPGIMQGGHILAFRFEGNDIEARELFCRFRDRQTTLGGGYNESPFGGIPLHLPAAFFLDQDAVVAEQSGPQTFKQCRGLPGR